MSFWSALGNTLKGINPISAISDVVNAGANVYASAQQAKLGKAQIQAQYDINQSNIEEAEKGRDFQREMFNAQNEYNDPSAVKERFENAGLNPYLMMSGGNMGTAASTPSSPGIPSLQAPDYTASMQANQMLADSVSRLAQVHNLNSQSELTSQQAEYYGQEKIAQIYQLYNSAKNDSERTYFGNLLSFAQANNFVALTQKAQQDIEESRARVAEINQSIAHDVILTSIDAKFLEHWDEQFTAQMDNLVADTGAKLATKTLTEREAVNAIYHRGLIIAQTASERSSANLMDNQAETQTAMSRNFDASSSAMEFDNRVNQGNAEYAPQSNYYWSRQQAKAIVRNLKKNGDWIDANNTFNMVNQTLNTVLNGAETYGDYMPTSTSVSERHIDKRGRVSHVDRNTKFVRSFRR